MGENEARDGGPVAAPGQDGQGRGQRDGPDEAPATGSKGFLMRAMLGVVLAVAVSSRSESVKQLLARPQASGVSAPLAQLNGELRRAGIDGESGRADAALSGDDLLSDEEDEEDEASDGGEDHDAAASESIPVVFDNQWRASVALYWESQEDEWVEVVKSFKGPTNINTYAGHRFMFAREGTQDQVGEIVEIDPDQRTYVLGADSKRLAEVADPCADRFPKRCQNYAKQGECEENPGWMIVMCPKACNKCDLLDAKKRCQRSFLNITDAHVWQPGDLDKMFQRIVEDFADLEVRIESEPPDGPWILVFDNFLTDLEIDTMLKWGRKLGYERSTDVGEQNERGETTKVVSLQRTSSNTWCSNDCERDPVVRGITEKIERITRVPVRNYESFQLLEYTHGQYYRVHHDMSPSARDEPAGPRILTFFLYLSDVEEGGETNFPRVKGGIKVDPRRGRAVLWPSVMNDDPYEQDPRTYHAALPVSKGTKYASNHWIHSHDFRKANHWGCTGAF